MIEVRFHGRGGQGSVIASELLAHAAFLDGKFPQSFPFFGVERRGAPVTAYARIDNRPIAVRTSVRTPDLVVVLDAGLLRVVPVTDGLRPGGWVLANTRLRPDELQVPLPSRTATVDATGIALAHGLGSRTQPIVNTAVLGAIAGATGIVSLDAVQKAIDEHVPARPKENQAAAADGYSAVRHGEGRVRPPSIPKSPVARIPFPDGPIAETPSAVFRTGSWRTLRPVLHLEHCTRCNFCWKYCPDDAIEFDAQGYPVLRLQYCKGCGICATECPPHVIEMVSEEEVGGTP
jgi:2-oxoacid:acceptor oxidoreductase gamma subunit (pyruvate/2-ketoisovalerate family)/2-oxoacid:acceptor oxidoreductase delta subunit (pyruvate/2-ketoisovalerate family)